MAATASPELIPTPILVQYLECQANYAADPRWIQLQTNTLNLLRYHRLDKLADWAGKWAAKNYHDLPLPIHSLAVALSALGTRS